MDFTHHLASITHVKMYIRCNSQSQEIILFYQSPACKINQMSSTVVRGGEKGKLSLG